MSEYNPFAAPSDFGDITTADKPFREYGGIRRLPYFGYSFLVNIVTQGMQALAAANDMVPLAYAAIPVSVAGALYLTYQRCKNIGMNPWWCLGIIVPLVNIFVGLRCTAYPEGYEDHKTLDGPAKIIIGIFVAAIILTIIAVVGVIFLAAKGR